MKKKKQMTASEMGKKGGKKTWANISKKERSKRMKKLAQIRWEKLDKSVIHSLNNK